MAKTKEEILDKHLFNRFDDTDKKSFLSAMDEYAKQEAVAFGEYKDNYQGDLWDGATRVTNADLYNGYLQSKAK